MERNNAAQFYSQFNSSTIYATANKEGDVHVNVKLAIEYPNEYANEKNWFDTSTNIKVAEKLKIDVPEYSRPEYQQTSLYLVPPNTKAHI